MTSRKETERTKLIQEKCQNLLTQMLRDEDNKYCVDCDAKGPRWASWNLGVFLCIRCAGIHRNLGVHISRVKSVNLDTWTPEQVVSLQQMGNSRARAVYEAQLPDGFRRPQTDTALESFIRAKYEHKKYLAREWVPPSPPKVDWGKEIDEEIEKQKRKKKSTSGQLGGISAPLSSSNLNSSSDKKMSSTSNSVKNTPLPAPLPKPKSSNSPKTSNRIDLNSSASSSGNNSTLGNSSDLLGLSSPTNATVPAGKENQNGSDQFTNFLSATSTQNSIATNGNVLVGKDLNKTIANSLAKEEEDFFNQTTSLGCGLAGDRDKTGKLTKDSILALYGTSGQNANPSNLGQFSNNPLGGVSGAFNNAFSGGFMQSSIPNQQQQSHQTFQSANINLQGTGVSSGSPGGVSTNLNLNLAGMPQGLLGPPQQVNQIVHPHQFMQPPSSMYNAPVMTAPHAFTSASGGSVGGAGSNVPLQYQNMNLQQQRFGQFPSQNTMNLNSLQMHQQSTNIFPGSFNSGAVNNMQSPFIGNAQNTFNSVPVMGGTGGQPTTNPAGLSQQFGNLNLGNVWQ